MLGKRSQNFKPPLLHGKHEIKTFFTLDFYAWQVFWWYDSQNFTMNISFAKIDRTKKNSWAYNSSPTKIVRSFWFTTISSELTLLLW